MNSVSHLFGKRHSIVSAKPPEQPALPLAPDISPQIADHQPRSLAMAQIDLLTTAAETALGYLDAIEGTERLGAVGVSRLAAAKVHLLTALRRRVT